VIQGNEDSEDNEVVAARWRQFKQYRDMCAVGPTDYRRKAMEEAERGPEIWPIRFKLVKRRRRVVRIIRESRETLIND
jgi:hypothetical protein